MFNALLSLFSAPYDGVIANLVYFVLANLGKFVAHSVLDLLSVERYHNLCFFGNVGKGYCIGACAAVLNAVQSERRSSCIHGYGELVSLTPRHDRYLVNTAFGERESAFLDGGFLAVDKHLFKAGDKVDFFLKLADSRLNNGETELYLVTERINELDRIGRRLGDVLAKLVLESFAILGDGSGCLKRNH